MTSAGCQSLLQTCTGLTACILCQVQGDVLYNGKNFDEFVVEKSSGYVEQTDQHYPPLTVRETLDFAALCQGPGHQKGQYKFKNCHPILLKGNLKGTGQGQGRRQGEGEGNGKGSTTLLGHVMLCLCVLHVVNAVLATWYCNGTAV